MSEIELLTALSKADGGVQVNISASGVRVSTRYTPLVSCKGKTIFEAARDAAIRVRESVKAVPSWKDGCRKVLDALDEYDRKRNFQASIDG